MKVNTDGILLGAWADISDNQHILDVGTGSGLIAIMLAQRTDRTNAQIMAVELDIDAAKQAKENVELSQWADRLQVVHANFTHMSNTGIPTVKFDHLVSNPPFFNDSLQNKQDNKTMARHQSSLSFEDLIRVSTDLTTKQGKLSVVLPVPEMDKFEAIARDYGWYTSRKLNVRNQNHSKIIRQLIELTKSPQHVKPFDRQNLALRDDNGNYSLAYQSLCKAFYLKF